MTSQPPLEPRRPDVPASLARRDLAGERLIGLRVDEAELAGELCERAAADLRLQAVRLRGLDLGGTEAPGLVLTDAVVSGGSWANLRAVRGALTRVETTELRATGLDVSEALLADVVFAGARLDLSSFRFARLTRVRFEDCRLEEADFHGARLDSVRFERSTLTGASFSEATCERCELRSCELAGLRGVEGLRGSRLSWPDALQLTAALAIAAGLTIVD